MEKAITPAYFNAVRVYQRPFPFTSKTYSLNCICFFACWINSDQSVSQNCCVFSRAWHSLCVFPRFSTLEVCFPHLAFVTSFPALGITCVFSRALASVKFVPTLGLCSMFSRAWQPLCVSRAWQTLCVFPRLVFVTISTPGT